MPEFFPENSFTAENELKDTKETGLIPAAKDGGNEDDGLEENKKPDDEFASPEDVDMLKMDINNEIKARAGILGITEDALKDYLSLDIDNLESYNLTNHGLEITRENLENAVKGFWKLYRDKKECLPYSDTFFDKIKEVTKSKVIPMGMLTVYLSSFGSAFLKELAGSEVKLEYGGKHILIKDLVKDPSLMEEIDKDYNEFGNPSDTAFSPDSFKYEDKSNGNIVRFSFDAMNHEGGGKDVYIASPSNSGNPKAFRVLESDLHNMGIASNPNGCVFPLDILEKNKEQIIDLFARDLNIPRDEVAKYVEGFLNPQAYKNVKVIEPDQFKAGNFSEVRPDLVKLQYKYLDIQDKYNISGDSPIENSTKANDEWQAWGKTNGYSNVDKAREEEAERLNNSSYIMMNRLAGWSDARLAEETYSYDNFHDDKTKNSDLGEKYKEKKENELKFKNELLGALKQRGFDLPKLKEMGRKSRRQS